MGRSLKYEIPGIDRRVPLDEWVEQGWAGVFADDQPAETHRRVLEIGFGRGEFLLGLAAQSPGTWFVGVEISFKRTLKMARKVGRAGLANVRLIEARAEEALRVIAPVPCLDEIWINFSDPWPKGRHAHRRLIRPDFAVSLARALAPGGVLHLATDDVPYAHQMDEVLHGESRLQNLNAPWPFVAEVPGRPRTGYEEQWRAEGRPMHFFEYGLRPLEGRE
jgi:tRNA (guanine-N7-)-methyltransferase